jgi:hypothetical protein
MKKLIEKWMQEADEARLNAERAYGHNRELGRKFASKAWLLESCARELEAELNKKDKP